MKQQLVADSATDQIELTVWDHNTHVVPTAALISILIDGATEVSLASATISSTGVCTYIPGATILDDLSENCIALWKLTVGGNAQYHRQVFDIVRNPLNPVVTDEDLIAECAQLQDSRYMEVGLADSGGPNSLISILLQEYQDNHFEGGTLEITDGACAGQKQRITSNTRSTGTIVVDTSFGSSITTTSRFVAKRTFQREIDRAWDDVQAMIQTKGYRPALIMNNEDLKPVHLYWSLVKVCRNLAKQPDDIWWKRADVFHEEYQAKLGLVNFLYDSDEDEWPESTQTFKPSFRR